MYRIKIEKIIDPEKESTYPSYHEIYTQEVEEVDIEAVIKAVNKMPDERT